MSCFMELTTHSGTDAPFIILANHTFFLLQVLAYAQQSRERSNYEQTIFARQSVSTLTSHNTWIISLAHLRSVSLNI